MHDQAEDHIIHLPLHCSEDTQHTPQVITFVHGPFRCELDGVKVAANLLDMCL